MSEEQAWDERYAQDDRIWSGAPNVVLVQEVAGLTPGTALDLGCGEGADAVWLAKQGWQVTGVDISGVALARAGGHAADAGVSVDFQHRDLSTSFPPGVYDLVSAQFLYSWGDLDRDKVLRQAAEAVAPGGVLLIGGHQDHGPFGHGDGVHFASTDEVIAALDLDDTWEVLVQREHPRQQTGPDGEQHTRTDSTIKLRRRS
ncbi:MAG: class I SAM-dependent methyltransferase [Actinoplanes sp.]